DERRRHSRQERRFRGSACDGWLWQSYVWFDRYQQFWRDTNRRGGDWHVHHGFGERSHDNATESNQELRLVPGESDADFYPGYRHYERCSWHARQAILTCASPT